MVESYTQYRSPKLTDQIRLRYTSAIETKSNIMLNYINKKIVGKSDPVIIAVSSSNIKADWPGNSVSEIVKCCYGLDQQAIQFNLDTKDNKMLEPESSYTFKCNTLKCNDIFITDRGFLEEKYSHVSGIIFTYFHILGYENKLIFLHNPHAKNPIELGVLDVEEEWWFDKSANCLRKYS